MTNKKVILKGNSNFSHVVANNGYYVDKTLLVKEFYESGYAVLVIPRPRRFGKTSNLSMVEHFFSVTKKDSAPLFKSLKISDDKPFCQTHQNSYPVINITFKNSKGEDWETCLQYIKEEITELYRNHKFLLDSPKLESFEKYDIEKIIFEKGNPKDYVVSLFKLKK